jgi:myo-inositol 2-dehydrogenase/D-chiro-inositol 1-dehydrogenase
VGYWRRFVPALARLRTRVREGALGGIYRVSCFQWDENPPSAEFRSGSGGIVVDMGVHEFEMLRWLTGQEIVAAAGYSSSTTSVPPVPGDPEAAEMVVLLSAGSLGNVSLGRRLPAGETLRVEVQGTQGAVRLDYVAPPRGGRVFTAALRRQAEAFAAAVRGEGQVGADAAAAEAALAAAELVGQYN